MSFYQQLQDSTSKERAYLLSAPIVGQCHNGDFSLETYKAFLAQAYYHVRHTVPLLMATGSRLSDEQEWVRGAIKEYIDEEYGHQEWILNDIAACGGNAEAVRHGHPGRAIELMVAFLYDQINRGNPLSIFGMVQVLEGTSVSMALMVAEQLRTQLGLQANTMSYLTSHGELDQDHLKFFSGLMDKITQETDQQAIIHAAKIVYGLYGDMLRELTAEAA